MGISTSPLVPDWSQMTYREAKMLARYMILEQDRFKDTVQQIATEISSDVDGYRQISNPKFFIKQSLMLTSRLAPPLPRPLNFLSDFLGPPRLTRRRPFFNMIVWNAPGAYARALQWLGDAIGNRNSTPFKASEAGRYIITPIQPSLLETTPPSD